MNSRISVSILNLGRLASIHGVLRRCYCNALKPEIQTAVNCCDIMTKSRPDQNETANQINLDKVNQLITYISSNRLVNKAYDGKFSVLNFIKVLKTLKVHSLQIGTTLNLRTDQRFLKLCELFEVNCHKASPFVLISALRGLLALNVGQETKIVETIGRTILEKFDKFDGNDMVECLLVLHNVEDISDVQRDIVKAILNEIPQKLHDLISGASVFKLIKVYDMFDRKHTRKLDFKLVELLTDFTPHYLCKLLCLLAKKQNRNKTLLKAISYRICDSENKPSLKQTVDILYALNTLNFPDSSLLLHLTNNRTSEICAVDQPSLVSSLLTVCGHLRWRHKEILEACGQWILNNIDKCSSREYVSYVLTVAMLNYTPVDILNHLLPRLKEEKITPSTVCLDVIWSLAILGCVDKEMLLGVLMKEFYEPLIDGSDFCVTSNKLKLMNLKSVLKNKHPECIFSCDLFLDSVEVPKSYEVENSKRSVITALSHFILPEKFMYTNQCTDMGISIDAEFILDVKGKPLPLLEYGSKMKSTTSVKALPPDARRVAVLVLTHKDFTLNEPHVIGIISLTVELLRSQGYIVIQVPYSEFSESTTAVKKVHYLQKKIMKTLELNLDEKKV